MIINNEANQYNILFDKDWILRKAEESMKVNPMHITDNVAYFSEGGVHDYYSNGDYWWPNPDTSDGLPYVQRDGESNPGNFFAHRICLRSMRTNVSNLAAAYKLNKDERYAQKSVLLLKQFFIDEETKMNPHLLYAQAIPGICTGRGIGIIDTLHLIDVPFAIEVLKNSEYMSNELYLSLKLWFSDYLIWMCTHPYGIEEMNAKNNHSVCWFVQAAVFAKFTDNHEVMDFCRDKFKTVLLPSQMAPDGSFPLELKRTKPYSYSLFVLDNMVTLCHVLSDENNNLWDFELEDGRCIRKGLEFLYPYIEDKALWPFPPDIEHFGEWPVRMPFMIFSGVNLRENRFIELWKKLNSDPVDEEIRRNIAIRQPILWM